MLVTLPSLYFIWNLVCWELVLGTCVIEALGSLETWRVGNLVSWELDELGTLCVRKLVFIGNLVC